MSKRTVPSRAHRVAPAFETRLVDVMNRFFARDARLWPCFGDPGFRRMLDFRHRFLAPGERLAAYPEGKRLRGRLLAEKRVPPRGRAPGASPDKLLVFAAALSKDWENPASVENVITMPCDPAIYGSMLGTLANPNLVYEEYAGMAAELERSVVRQMASLAGYDPTQ